MSHLRLFIACIAIIASLSQTLTAQGKPNEADNSFATGKPISSILPVTVAEAHYDTVNTVLSGKRLNVMVLAAGGKGFDSVTLGIYDPAKQDVAALWSSDQTELLPFAAEKILFEDLSIKYTYLPGDKYLSSNIKIAAGVSGRASEAVKFFMVQADTRLEGFPLKVGDILVASDSAGQGFLSRLGDNDYTDIVFILRAELTPTLPTPGVVLAIGSGSLFGLTWWKFRRPDYNA